jgi:nucleotide-binding universal stress UspA family protein
MQETAPQSSAEEKIAVKLQAFVPLVTYPEANSEAIAVHAVAVAAGIGADIHALAVNVDIPDISNALSKLLLDTPRMIREAEASSRRRGERLLAAIREKASAAGIATTTEAVVAEIAMLGDTAASQARYFDLSLVGWEAGNATSRMAAEAVIFGSGRPAVLLPERCEITPFEHVAIAWDGSRVAARAAADAGLFLERAARISVITVVDEKPLKETDAGERLAAALVKRGLKADAVPVEAEDGPIAQTLQQVAIERGCKLLVMGGYGHSRMRAFVLGGATEGVLSDLHLPVLLSH